MWDLREYHVVDKPREREGRDVCFLSISICDTVTLVR